MGKASRLDCSVQVLRGVTAIRAGGPEIAELVRRTGQDENPLLCLDRLLRTRPGYFAIGLRAKERWLSFLVGMRAGTSTYVLLQMNLNGYARYSLSTVLRSYFFEHEIARGQQELRFVNGTCTAFQRCCESDRCVTVTARRGLAAFVLFNWIAPWYSAPDDALNMKRWTA